MVQTRHYSEYAMPFNGPPLTRHNPIDSLLSAVETKPDELALASVRTQLTWRELDNASTRLAAQYLASGLSPGERVASLMPNRPALVIHYLACIKSGLVATPLNYRYMPPEIDHALEVSGAAMLLHHAERDEDVAASRLGSQLPKGVIRYKATDGRGPHFEEFVSSKSPESKLPSAGAAWR